MSSIPTKHIDGDVAVGRNVASGGDAQVQGSARIGHNLKVEGWLEAPNIKGVQKGLFGSEEALCEAYPRPENGWYAMVGTGFPARVYTAKGGKWEAQSKSDGTPSTVDNVIIMDSEYTINTVAYFDEVNDTDTLNTSADQQTAPYQPSMAPAGSRIVLLYPGDGRFYGYDGTTYYHDFVGSAAFGKTDGKGIAPKKDTLYICRTENSIGRIFLYKEGSDGWKHLVKADADLRDRIAGKVDKVSGKGLSSNDYTDADKAKADMVVDLGRVANKDAAYSAAAERDIVRGTRVREIRWRSSDNDASGDGCTIFQSRYANNRVMQYRLFDGSAHTCWVRPFVSSGGTHAVGPWQELITPASFAYDAYSRTITAKGPTTPHTADIRTWTLFTLPLATTTTAGLMSAKDKQTLDRSTRMMAFRSSESADGVTDSTVPRGAVFYVLYNTATHKFIAGTPRLSVESGEIVGWSKFYSRWENSTDYGTQTSEGARPRSTDLYVDADGCVWHYDGTQLVSAAANLRSAKVDKENGKGLSSNDYTDADKAKVDLGAATLGVLLGREIDRVVYVDRVDFATEFSQDGIDGPTLEAGSEAIDASEVVLCFNLGRVVGYDGTHYLKEYAGADRFGTLPHTPAPPYVFERTLYVSRQRTDRGRMFIVDSKNRRMVPVGLQIEEGEPGNVYS